MGLVAVQSPSDVVDILIDGAHQYLGQILVVVKVGHFLIVEVHIKSHGAVSPLWFPEYILELFKAQRGHFNVFKGGIRLAVGKESITTANFLGRGIVNDQCIIHIDFYVLTIDHNFKMVPSRGGVFVENGSLCTLQSLNIVLRICSAIIPCNLVQPRCKTVAWYKFACGKCSYRSRKIEEVGAYSTIFHSKGDTHIIVIGARSKSDVGFQSIIGRIENRVVKSSHVIVIDSSYKLIRIHKLPGLWVVAPTYPVVENICGIFGVGRDGGPFKTLYIEFVGGDTLAFQGSTKIFFEGINVLVGDSHGKYHVNVGSLLYFHVDRLAEHGVESHTKEQ